MSGSLRLTFIVAVAFSMSTFSLTGCGNSGPVLIKARGQVQKGGEDFVPDDGEHLQIVFTPISPDGKPARNLYVAEVDQSTGSFYASGADKKGMPPGKYRAAVELRRGKKDLLNDKFNLVDSPFVFEIEDLKDTMVIDLDAEPEAAKKPGKK